MKSKRLGLRVFKLGDEESMLKFWGNEEVMAYCPGPLGTVESFKKTIRFYSDLYKNKDYSVFAIELLESGDIIGACGFNPTDDEKTIELIYHFAKPYWRKGYATEACFLVMEKIPKMLNITKVEASVDPKNKASEIILKKLGFDFIESKWFDDSKCFENCYSYNIR
jgi:ribosomal-protein-alanine N-acetyltransferase